MSVLGIPAGPVPETFRVAAWLDDPSCRVGSEVAAVLGAAVDALDLPVTAPAPPTSFDELWALHLDMVPAAVAYNLPEDGVPAATATHRGWLAVPRTGHACGRRGPAGSPTTTCC